MGEPEDESRAEPTRSLDFASIEPCNWETPTDRLDDPITPSDDLFLRNHGSWPAGIPTDPDAWRFELDGEVERPMSLSVEELRTGFDLATVTSVLECAGNGRRQLDPPVDGLQWHLGAVGCARYGGVRLVDLLQRAGPTPRAVYTAHHSPDRTVNGEVAISRGLPLWKALSPETLLAFEMNGEPLPRIHGGPLRLVAPGFPGAAWQKWLARIEVRDREHDGEKMTGTDYRLPAAPLEPGDRVDPDAFRIIEDIPVKSLITHPLDGGTVRVAELTEVRGWAWSGHIPVARVEVSVDDGESWLSAGLEPAEDRWAWQRFRLPWTPAAKDGVTILARAFDSAGHVQPIDQAWNPRGYCNNGCQRVRVTAV
jgi:sulfite oxidase